MLGTFFCVTDDNEDWQISGSFEWKGCWTRCFQPSWLYTAGMTFKVTLWSAWQLSTIVIEQEFLHLCTFEWMIFFFNFETFIWKYFLLLPNFFSFWLAFQTLFVTRKYIRKWKGYIFFMNYLLWSLKFSSKVRSF